MVLWVVAGLALIVAALAWSATRRLARRFDGLNQSYWELRYDYTRLRSQVSRLDPEQVEEDSPSPAPAAPTVSFVPLSSMKSGKNKKTDSA